LDGRLHYNDDGGVGACSHLELELPPGEHLFVVDEYGRNAEIPFYTFNFSAREYLPGGSRCDATGLENLCEGEQPCNDPDEDNDGSCGDLEILSPLSGDLVITELIKDPSVVDDALGEWIEIYNPQAVAFELAGCLLADNDADRTLIDVESLIIFPGDYLLLGRNANPNENGGVELAYLYSGFTLSNGADEVVLLNPDGQEIDRVDYNDNDFPDVRGASMQLNGDPASVDNSQGQNWCVGSVPFGQGDLGTPGEANICR